MGVRKVKTEKKVPVKKVSVPDPIRQDQFAAFSRKDLEAGIQLDQHLRNIGHTFNELAVLITEIRSREMNARIPKQVQEGIRPLTRDEIRATQRPGKRR